MLSPHDHAIPPMEIHRAARAAAHRDFRMRRQNALDAEVEAILAQTGLDGDIRWREVVTQHPPALDKWPEELARANITRSRLRLAAIEKEENARHTAQQQAILDRLGAHAMLYNTQGLEDLETIAALSSVPGVTLAPHSAPRGGVGGVSPEEMIFSQGPKDLSAFELHWRRVGTEEAAFLRQHTNDATDARIKALRGCGQAQVVDGEATIRARDRHLRYAEDSAVTMRNAWLVLPPPFHFERQLTQRLKDHEESWVETSNRRLAQHNN